MESIRSGIETKMKSFQENIADSIREIRVDLDSTSKRTRDDVMLQVENVISEIRDVPKRLKNSLLQNFQINNVVPITINDVNEIAVLTGLANERFQERLILTVEQRVQT